MATYLDCLIDYDTWANQGLLDFLREQPPEMLDLTAGGVYGTIRETLEHLFSSEMGYSRRLTPSPARDLPHRPEHPDLETLQALLTELPRGWPTWSTRSPSQGQRSKRARGCAPPRRSSPSP